MSDIVILEDDGVQQCALREALEHRFYDRNLRMFSTEVGFIENLEHFSRQPPALFLLDSMVTHAYPVAGDDPRLILETHPIRDKATAGIRCLRRIRAIPSLGSVPSVLFTVLTIPDLRSAGVVDPEHEIEGLGAIFLPKIDSLDPVVDIVEEILT